MPPANQAAITSVHDCGGAYLSTQEGGASRDGFGVFVSTTFPPFQNHTSAHDSPHPSPGWKKTSTSGQTHGSGRPRQKGGATSVPPSPPVVPRGPERCLLAGWLRGAGVGPARLSGTCDLRGSSPRRFASRRSFICQDCAYGVCWKWASDILHTLA